MSDPQNATPGVTSAAVVFDPERAITITLKTPAGAKKVVVRYPTDAEWIDRNRRRKVYIKTLGRGKSKTDSPDSSDLDLELFEKIRQPGLPNGDAAEIDAYEAAQILEQISKAEVRGDDFEEIPGGYRIRLHVPGGVTVHELTMPSAKDLFRYRRDFANIVDDSTRGRQIVTVNLPVAGELYDKLFTRSEGYPPGYPGPLKDLPINHRVTVVKRVLDEVSGDQEDKEEDF